MSFLDINRHTHSIFYLNSVAMKCVLLSAFLTLTLVLFKVINCSNNETNRNGFSINNTKLVIPEPPTQTVNTWLKSRLIQQANHGQLAHPYFRRARQPTNLVFLTQNASQQLDQPRSVKSRITEPYHTGMFQFIRIDT